MTLITPDAAAKALDSMDDYARMSCGVDAHGPRGVLERFIAQVRQGQVSQAAVAEQADPDVAEPAQDTAGPV